MLNCITECKRVFLKIRIDGNSYNKTKFTRSTLIKVETFTVTVHNEDASQCQATVLVAELGDEFVFDRLKYDGLVVLGTDEVRWSWLLRLSLARNDFTLRLCLFLLYLVSFHTIEKLLTTA